MARSVVFHQNAQFPTTPWAFTPMLMAGSGVVTKWWPMPFHLLLAGCRWQCRWRRSPSSCPWRGAARSPRRTNIAFRCFKLRVLGTLSTPMAVGWRRCRLNVPGGLVRRLRTVEMLLGDWGRCGGGGAGRPLPPGGLFPGPWPRIGWATTWVDHIDPGSARLHLKKRFGDAVIVWPAPPMTQAGTKAIGHASVAGVQFTCAWRRRRFCAVSE